MPVSKRGIVSALCALAMGWSVSCDSALDTTLDGKRCAADRSCLPGYICSPADYCVRPERTYGSRSDSDAAARDQAGRSAADGGIFAADGGTSCNAPRTRCPIDSHSCVDTTSDVAHCGACERACTAAKGGTARCTRGQCQTLCPPGFIECAGQCVDASSAEHCGSCQACAADESCVSGQCQTGCSDADTRCAGTCVDTSRDARHCGACGNACAANVGMRATCNAGRCDTICEDETRERCTDECVDYQSDRRHCGGCGRACPTMENGEVVCQAGECKPLCNSGYTLCREGCSANSLVTSAQLLGFGLVSVCDAFDLVFALTEVVCDESQQLCDGMCVDPASTDAHCGGCGAQCAAPTICRMARCVAGPQ